MELYLIRHGLAAERGDAYPDDRLRPLTVAGIQKIKKEAAGLVALGVSFDLILSSPLVRARQTADRLAAGLTPHPPVVEAAALAPGGTFAAVVDAVADHTRLERIALVGHEPEIGKLAARLIGGRTPLRFKKGSVCRIDLEAVPPAGPGLLQWLVTPKMLRRIG